MKKYKSLIDMASIKALKSSCFTPLLSPHLHTSTILSKSQINSKLRLSLNTHRPTNLTSPNPSKKTGFLMFPCTPASCNSTASTIELEQELSSASKHEQDEEKFDWYAQWYPIIPLCDLDKRKPHGNKVMGLDIVVWWDRNDQEWKVFEDRCPHRLAPLSEGRIDPQGRLQCVYHGWCFDGSGGCKFIPQAPIDGPPVHKSKKACVASYPCYAQNGLLWFFANSSEKYKDIILKNKPPYIAELDDPSYFTPDDFISRDVPYGYEVLMENLMDPSHAAYAHHNILKVSQPPERYVEGGRPLEIYLDGKINIKGFATKQDFGGEDQVGDHIFTAPSLLISYMNRDKEDQHIDNSSHKQALKKKRYLVVFICVPVSPGNSRIIVCVLRNYLILRDRFTPIWMSHLLGNLIVDSDLNLLHVSEKNLMEAGQANWHKSCFVPTKADTNVILFRRWLSKYSGDQLDWGSKFSNGLLPPTPNREKLMDRYWSHTVNCKSCSMAHKYLSALEIILQICSISLIGLAAISQGNTHLLASRTALVFTSISSFVASKWLSKFIYRSFVYHDYSHASIKTSNSFLVRFICAHTGLT